MKKEELLENIRQFKYRSIRDFYQAMQELERSDGDAEEIQALLIELGQDKVAEDWDIPEEYRK